MRFEDILTMTERLVTLGNTALMGHFNVYLGLDTTDLSRVMLKLKDRLLEVYPLAGLVQVMDE